jgi:hypothetical protein
MHIVIISFLVCISLFTIHTYFMFTNTTTWERFSRRNITYLRNLSEPKSNPFNESYLRNVIDFLCYCNEKRWDDKYAIYMKNKERVGSDISMNAIDEIENIYSNTDVEEENPKNLIEVLEKNKNDM